MKRPGSYRPMILGTVRQFDLLRPDGTCGYVDRTGRTGMIGNDRGISAEGYRTSLLEQTPRWNPWRKDWEVLK